jgi:hypothetical protein
VQIQAMLDAEIKSAGTNPWAGDQTSGWIKLPEIGIGQVAE